MIKTISRVALAALCVAFSGTTASAQSRSFDVALAGRTVGQISVSATGGGSSLRSVFDNTPLGVGDGRFDASYADGTYRSLGQSPGESRRIDMAFANGRVTDVQIAPATERTDASDPAGIPAGVLDPVRGFARIALSRDCVAPYAMYDGRRVVTVRLRAQSRSGGTLTCEYAYDVTMGPGHLSPFRFRSITMTTQHRVADTGTGLPAEITLGTGPFSVRLVNR